MKSDSLSRRSSRLPADGSVPERTLFDWPRDSGTSEAVLQELDEQLRLRRRRRGRVRGAVGAIALLLAGAWMWQRPAAPAPALADSSPATATVPIRQVLPDGSVILLRAGAELRVNFSIAARRVHMARGEALFDVARDSDRPFIVHAGGVDVRAIGTAFTVTRLDTSVEVIVTEGKVAMQKAGVPASDGTAAGAMAGSELRPIEPGHPLALIPAGHRAMVEDVADPLPPAVLPVSDREVAERLSWRVPTLRFDRTPLRDVVALVNQHSPLHLVLEGVALAELPLSGAMRADNIDALIELLESDYAITAEPRGGSEIVLHQAR